MQIKIEDELKKQIEEASSAFYIDWYLVASICYIESAFNKDALRFEPGYRWTCKPEHYARLHHITISTEKALQMFSWGLMQVMGGTVRDLGYDGKLQDLLDPKTNLYYGCLYLKHKIELYSKIEDAIAAYNAGVAIRDLNNNLKNQMYVDKVMTVYDYLRRV